MRLRTIKRVQPGAETGPPIVPIEEELVLDEDEGLSPEERELARTLVEIEKEVPMDNGEQAHDDAVIRSTRDRAMAGMGRRGVRITEAANKMALGIYPKVAGLARRVHDSVTLGTKFETLVAADNTLLGERKGLTRQIPTRWNSEYDCLESHMHFFNPVEALTVSTVNKLGSFKLTDLQWLLAQEVLDVLAIFDGPTKLFSKKETPLARAIIPMFEDLKDALKRIENAPTPSPVIRVAAHTALLVLQKYHSPTDDCEVYRISIAMCPDKKLQWLKDRRWSAAAVE
ncbi:hypothetical protein DFH09DRAFT_909471 [Mycena vulgaris]|nr:hypothetical protein DFH09DRAFT_909471 [Mycena vulgaris]